MSLPIPDLDDKRFSQLVEEARKLIPGYSSEWTDHNLSDPGITLIDLFAWLSEIALYRTNLVTENHRLKYLQLLGVKPQPSKQARVDLTFTSDEEKTFSKGTKVWTKINDKKIYFQLEEDITILPQLKIDEKNTLKILEKIVVHDLTSGVYDRSHSNLDEKGDLFFAPFGNEIQKGCAMYLGFVFLENKVPNTLDLMCYLYEKDLIEIKKYDIELDYKVENTGLKWETWVKKENKGEWNPVLLKDETQGFRKSGKIVFKNLNGWTASQIIPDLGYDVSDSKKTYFWLRCMVEDAFYEYPPRIENLRLNTVSAVHGLMVNDDNLELVSNGLPGQVIELREKPVVDNTLKLSLEEWVEVDDFEGSGPSDKHFVLNKEKGEIKFGDGLMGFVPSQGSKIRVLEYITGGGEEGNLMPERRWEIDGFIGSSDYITNYFASTGGKEAQTIEEAIEDFCRDLKTPYTAVTLQDFEQLALSTPGLRIARAKAIPNYDPKTDSENSEEGRGSVTVVIIPYTPLEILRTPPEPSVDFKKAVCAQLDKHRVLGTDIHVISPIYVKVTVNATVVPMDSYRDDSHVRKDVIEKLTKFIHPITGGMNEKGWPIGRDVYLSDLYNIIENIQGVNCVLRLSISGDQNASADADGNLILKSRIASIYSGIHNVEIFREKDQCFKRGDSYSGK